MSNRKAAQEFILKYIDKIFPGGDNKQQYEKLFASMSDVEFGKFINDLESGKRFLVATVPNTPNTKVTMDNNMKVAKELGYDFFHKLWIGAKANEPAYLTPVEYLVMDLPIRRQSQHLQKKRSVPEHTKTIDQLTGQPTGPSKGAKISYPELQVLAGMNMDESLIELIKFRGGDSGGYNAMNAMVLRYGNANLKTLAAYGTGVRSTTTLKIFLRSMHLNENL